MGELTDVASANRAARGDFSDGAVDVNESDRWEVTVTVGTFLLLAAIRDIYSKGGKRCED